MTERKKEKKEKQSFYVGGTVYKTYLPDGFEERRAYHKPQENMVKAFISGTITKIYVKKGQKVRKGDKLLILEAMKMKNQLLAPLDGRVEEVLVKEGEQVSKDQPLVFLQLEEEKEESL